jgi:phage gp36-like protein
MTALATPADMIKRFDVRELGDLVGDTGVRVLQPDLLTHANLQAALDDAYGEMLSVLTVGDRYTLADLAALTGDSKQYLIRVNCKLARKNLWERRDWSGDSDKRENAIEEGRLALDELRSGKKVLNTASADAGIPSIRTPSVSVIRTTNLVVDNARRGFYPSRRLPSNAP